MGLFFTNPIQGKIQDQDKLLVIILMGPPGCGKGTQSVELSKELNLPHISTGDLFRENMQKQTELGKLAKTFIDKGNLVPDQVVVDMLFDHIKKQGYTKGYILDGFPRTVSQAETLDKRLGNDVIKIAINLSIADDLLIERITGRLMCKDCGTPFNKTFSPPAKANICDKCQGALYQRDDDTKEVMVKRLSVYHNQTAPVIDFYKNEKVYYDVDAKKSKKEVFDSIVKTIDEVLSKPKA
ncbi:MAG: adenylate kinase [Chlamydiae bacterium]|nr:adenylate kinase [Chlamydiota bacterium]